MLELGLERTRQRLRSFEERYGLTSEKFGRRFDAGEATESLDFIEWAGEIKTYHLLEAQRQALQVDTSAKMTQTRNGGKAHW